MKRILAVFAIICMLAAAGLNPALSEEPAAVTPAPTGNSAPEGSPEKAMLDRMIDFFLYWSANRQDDMQTLCAPGWAAGVENPRTALFGLMANKTPLSLEVQALSGTKDDDVRIVTVKALVNRNNGKPAVDYRILVEMVREADGLWYVNPASLATAEKLEDDSATAEPTPEPLPEPSPEPESRPEEALELDPTPLPPEAGFVEPSVEMELSKTRFSAPETVTVNIRVINREREDMVKPVSLYDPDGVQIAEFGEPVLAAGQAASWTGEWDVTAEQLMEGKITFMMRCEVPGVSTDENGETGWIPRKVYFSRKIEYTGKDTAEIREEDAAEPGPDPDTLSSWGYIQAESVNMRAKAEYKGRRVSILKQYALVEILSTLRKDDGIWYRVSYGGKTGYVKGAYLKQMTLWELVLFMDSDLYRQGLENNGTNP